LVSAVRGQRGGLFAPGATLARRATFGETWTLRLSGTLAAGGGGGAPVGGGLMWRGGASLLRNFGPVQLGLSASHVRFPSGDIRSSQLGAVLAWDGEFRSDVAERIGTRVYREERSGLGFDRIAGTAARMNLHDGSGRRIDLVGARAERDVSATPGGLYWTLEAAAAARGGAAGYMEVLAGAGLSGRPLAARGIGLALGARASVGAAGGGGVPTGGGAVAKVALTASLPLSELWSVGAEAAAFGRRDLEHRIAQVWFARALEPSRPGGETVDVEVVGYEVMPVLQHIARVPRNDGTHRDLETMGLQLNRALGTNWYVTGQWHSAYAGGAGAYGLALIGLGWRSAAIASAAPWRVGIEAAGGAAGGGGVTSGGGAAMQARAWLGRALGPADQLRLGAGVLQTAGNDRWRKPVLWLAWSHALGLAGR
jgi:hypothetical protein